MARWCVTEKVEKVKLMNIHTEEMIITYGIQGLFPCRSQWELLLPSNTNWVASKQRKFVSHSSENWQSEIRGPALLSSGENPLLDCRRLVSLHSGETASTLFYKESL